MFHVKHLRGTLEPRRHRPAVRISRSCAGGGVCCTGWGPAARGRTQPKGSGRREGGSRSHTPPPAVRSGAHGGAVSAGLASRPLLTTRTGKSDFEQAYFSANSNCLNLLYHFYSYILNLCETLPFVRKSYSCMQFLHNLNRLAKCLLYRL